MQSIPVHKDVMKDIYRALVRVKEQFKQMVNNLKSSDNPHLVNPSDPYEAEIWKVVLKLVHLGSTNKAMEIMSEMRAVMSLGGKEEEQLIEKHVGKIFGHNDECGDDCPPEHFDDTKGRDILNFLKQRMNIHKKNDELYT